MNQPARRTLPLVVLFLIAAPLLAGCGDDQTSSDPQASPATLAGVNANCRQVRRDLVELGRNAFDGTTNLAEATTERIVKPSIPLLEDFARRQQKLAGGSGDPKLELYARLFEPMVILAEERLRSGEETSSPVNTAARGFEILTTTVADEQRQIAREAGLPACAIDFERVLTSSLGN